MDDTSPMTSKQEPNDNEHSEREIPEWRKQIRSLSWRSKPDSKHADAIVQQGDVDNDDNDSEKERSKHIRSASWRKTETKAMGMPKVDDPSLHRQNQEQQQDDDDDNAKRPIPEWRKRIRSFVVRRRSSTKVDQTAGDSSLQLSTEEEDVPPEDWKKLIRYYSSQQEIQKIGIQTFQQLVEHPKIAEFINWQDDVHGRTMLHCSIYQRRLDIAKLLLSYGADVNLMDQRGMTALMWAAYFGRNEMVKALLSRGADIHVANAKGDTALHSACRCGHVETVKILLFDGDGMDGLIVANEDADYPWMIAARRGHFGIMKLLTELNADIVLKATDQNGDSALMIAARCGHLDICKLLVEKSVNFKMANYDGDTALSLAYHEGHNEVMDFLLAKLLQEEEDDDEIPVAWAKLILKRNEFSRIDTETFVQRWMEHPKQSSFINWKNDFIEKGRTMLHSAIWYQREDIFRLLLEQGANVDATDKKGNTPLMYACEKGFSEMAKLLMERGANVQSTNNAGKPPLHWACCNGYLEICKSLIDHGANQHIDDDDDNSGKSPPMYLYRACEGGHLDVVQLLLSRGANVYMQTTQGSSPLQVASERNHTEIVWFLVRQYPALVME